jgi:nicotinamide riboside transporter PnuC
MATRPAQPCNYFRISQANHVQTHFAHVSHSILARLSMSRRPWLYTFILTFFFIYFPLFYGHGYYTDMGGLW